MPVPLATRVILVEEKTTTNALCVHQEHLQALLARRVVRVVRLGRLLAVTARQFVSFAMVVRCLMMSERLAFHACQVSLLSQVIRRVAFAMPQRAMFLVNLAPPTASIVLLALELTC